MMDEPTESYLSPEDVEWMDAALGPRPERKPPADDEGPRPGAARLPEPPPKEPTETSQEGK